MFHREGRQNIGGIFGLGSQDGSVDLHGMVSSPKALVLANSVTSDTVGVVLFAIRVAARAKLRIIVWWWEGEEERAIPKTWG